CSISPPRSKVRRGRSSPWSSTAAAARVAAASSRAADVHRAHARPARPSRRRSRPLLGAVRDGRRLLLLLLLARVLPRVTAIPALPLLAPWYRVVGDGERLLLEYAQSLVVLEGAAVRTLLPALLPLLDGTRSVDDLAARLGPPARPAIEAALGLLADHGVVIDGPDAPPDVRDAARAVAAVHRLPPAVAADRLRSASVGR